MILLALAILLATAGQMLLARHDLAGLGLYALAVLLFLALLWRDERVCEFTSDQVSRLPSLSVGKAEDRYGDTRDLAPSPPWFRRLWRLSLVPLALANAAIAFLAASDNTYRWYGVVAWVLAVGLFLLIFWERDPERSSWRWLGLSRTGWQLSWTALAVAGLILVGFWFRFWRLDDLPPEMTSDHIEKLLDVHDLVTGKRPIFFERNTGREPWQFYWTFMFIRLFDLETKYFALKLGTAVVGLLMLPGVYLLGHDLFGRWVGLWATLFAAVASWPVILSRVGLRFPFAPAATVWALLFLLRGLRDGRRNNFLLLGLWLGIGLQGYTAFRAMPLAVVVCWGLALILRPSSLKGVRPRSSLVRNALLTILVAVVVFIPLGRYALEHRDNFWMRSFSRIFDPNQVAKDSLPLTLFKNLGNLIAMFHWKGDNVWVNTLTDAPVLDPILGGLLVLGLVFVFWQGLCLRNPIPPLLLIAGAILLLPSALSLAYPIENPSVVRTGGAIPVVMTIAALPVGLGMTYGSHALRGWRRGLLALGALALAVAVTVVNYQRFFGDYWEQHHRRALNYTEIGAAIRGFVESGGDPANAWIIAWPHWIDTRGAGIEMGDPTWNRYIPSTQAPAALESHVEQPRPRFYVLYRQDLAMLERLHTLFPRGWSSIYASERPHYSFVLFYVPLDVSEILAPPLHPTIPEFLRDMERDVHAP